MGVDWIIYLLSIMIVWDFSMHFFSLLQRYNVTEIKHPLGAGKIFDAYAKGDKEKRRKLYELFWTIYWGAAFILILVYIIFK